jgi:hypothetical protein
VANGAPKWESANENSTSLNRNGRKGMREGREGKHMIEKTLRPLRFASQILQSH